MSQHEFEHSWSITKPSSESHQWSYRQACNACLAEIEVRHGVDWKVTDVRFIDKGRTTQTRQDWRGRRRWRCTHTVVAVYKVVRRPGLAALAAQETIEESVTVTYQMANPDYGIE